MPDEDIECKYQSESENLLQLSRIGQEILWRWRFGTFSKQQVLCSWNFEGSIQEFDKKFCESRSGQSIFTRILQQIPRSLLKRHLVKTRNPIKNRTGDAVKTRDHIKDWIRDDVKTLTSDPCNYIARDWDPLNVSPTRDPFSMPGWSQCLRENITVWSTIASDF